MKSDVPTLYPNGKVAVKVSEYSMAHSTPLPAPLIAYHAKIMEQERANMTISIIQAQALAFLARLTGAKRVLEIGVFRGFSSMVWSHAIGRSGKVTGLELSAEYAEIARRGFAEVEVTNVEILVGNALESLAALEPDEPYDLVFIDAQKTGYPDYLQKLLAKSLPGATRRVLKPGALIVADNILRRGLVADSSDDNPEAAVEEAMVAEGRCSPEDVASLNAFNDQMQGSQRIDTWLMPLFDGLGLGRLID